LTVWDWRADILKWKSAIYGTRPTPNRTAEEAILLELLGWSRSRARTLLTRFGSFAGLVSGGRSNLNPGEEKKLASLIDP
jgi:hypothetical protein